MTEERYLSVEFIYCACNCQHTKPKYDSNHRTSKYIKGHYAKVNPFNYKGGEYTDSYGYVYVFRPTHRLADCRGYIGKHRIVYEEYYKCSLLSWTHIHHCNGIKNDNTPSNLQPLTNSQHAALEQTKDMTGRICLLCLSPNTYVNKYGHSAWIKYQDGFICRKCYDKQYEKRKVRARDRKP